MLMDVRQLSRAPIMRFFCILNPTKRSWLLSVLFPQEGQPHPLAVGRTVPVVQGPAPGAQDRPPQDEPEVPVLSVHRHQGAGAELAGPGTRRAQGL